LCGASVYSTNTIQMPHSAVSGIVFTTLGRSRVS